MDSDQSQNFVGPDQGLNCSYRLHVSADNKKQKLPLKGKELDKPCPDEKRAVDIDTFDRAASLLFVVL